MLGYNDGRKKTLFCVAVNLLDLQELQEKMIIWMYFIELLCLLTNQKNNNILFTRENIVKPMFSHNYN